jgi:membrane glycosyltransferase
VKQRQFKTGIPHKTLDNIKDYRRSIRINKVNSFLTRAYLRVSQPKVTSNSTAFLDRRISNIEYQYIAVMKSDILILERLRFSTLSCKFSSSLGFTQIEITEKAVSSTVCNSNCRNLNREKHVIICSQLFTQGKPVCTCEKFPMGVYPCARHLLLCNLYSGVLS